MTFSVVIWLGEQEPEWLMVKKPKLVQFENEKKKACWKRVETDVTKTGNRKGWWKIGTKHYLKPSPISSFVSNSLLCCHYSFPSSPSSLLVPVPRFSKNPCWNASNLFFPKSTSKSAENYLQTILAFLIYKRKIWKSNKARRAASRHKDYQLPKCQKKKNGSGGCVNVTIGSLRDETRTEKMQ